MTILLRIFFVGVLWNYALAAMAEVTAEAVKAAYLYNFIKYIEWPKTRQNLAPAEIVIAIFNAREIYTILKQKEGAVFDTKKLLIKEITNLQVAQESHILFVGGTSSNEAATIKNLSQNGVLTVGESPHFAEKGGIINFVLKENTVQFEINWETAEAAGFKLSSKLLQSAIIVSTKP